MGVVHAGVVVAPLGRGQQPVGGVVRVSHPHTMPEDAGPGERPAERVWSGAAYAGQDGRVGIWVVGDHPDVERLQ